MTRKAKSRLMGLFIVIPVIIIILIGSSCSKEKVIPKYSDLQGKWSFSFTQIDTISGTFQIFKSDGEYFTSGPTIEKGDLYIALGEVKVGKNVVITNSEKYLLSDTITVYSLTPDLDILTFNNIKSNNNITISCNSQSFYYNNENHSYNQNIIIKRY